MRWVPIATSGAMRWTKITEEGGVKATEPASLVRDLVLIAPRSWGNSRNSPTDSNIKKRGMQTGFSTSSVPIEAGELSSGN